MTRLQASGQNKDHSPLEAVLSVLVSIAGAFVVLFPNNPNNMTLPWRDAGVFLYVGWRFLNGDIPYRDVWDHKPPGIYFIDALGLRLTPDSLWGVWCLEFIFIFFTIVLLYRLLNKEFGTYAAVSGAIIMTSGLLSVLGSGNMTEEYALLFQALSLWLFIGSWKKDFPGRTLLWIGLCGGLAFNLKQTTIGLWIAYALILFVVRISERKSPLKDFVPFIIGSLTPSVLFAVYFATQNALADHWEQAFLYNFVYIRKHEGIRRLIPVFLKGFLYLRTGGVLYLAGLGWLAGLLHTWNRWKIGLREIHPLILVALLDLPLEVILITVSGRSILHYYLTPLPIMAILAGVLVYTIPRLLKESSYPLLNRMWKLAPGILLAVIILFQYGQVNGYADYVANAASNDYAPVIEYVVQNTGPDDKVLLIGAESVVNFLARREAPTRYVYQYPLQLLGDRDMFEEYFNQILENKPALIIDTRGRTQLDEKLYVPMQKRSTVVSDGVKYLGENYVQVAQFGEWYVYSLIGDNN